MQHTGTIPIQTNRLLLRRFQQGDAKDIFEWTGSAENSRYIMERPHQNLGQAEQSWNKIFSNTVKMIFTSGQSSFREK